MTNDLSALPDEDRVAVTTTLADLHEGFRRRNADRLRSVYSADADWVNAFGSHKRGAEEIVGYLRGLFDDDNFNAGTVAGPPEVTIRVLTPDVVLVSAHLRIEGQGLLDGGTLDRDNHSLRVLARQPDGTWPVVSELFMDANREASYRFHS